MKQNINSSDSNNKVPKCPIDKSVLIVERANSCLLCPECSRRYYVSLDYDNKQKEHFNEYDNDDLITASSISNQGPILISSSHEMEDFKLNPIGEREGDNPQYMKVIRQKFGNDVKINTTTINY